MEKPTARWIYQSLPDTDSSCFVVTAAGRGHASVVGPFTEITHHGRKRRANQQLLIFWQFEAMWQPRAPRSHYWFRLVYNHVGPVIARQMTSPWRADAVWVARKPLEWTARLALNLGLLTKITTSERPKAFHASRP